jgi:Flp pilus assembly protein TadG
MSKMRLRDETGQALVEAALTLPTLLVLILGAAELTRVIYMSIEVSNAAEAGALYGSQNTGTAVDMTGIQNAAQNDALDVYHFTGTKVAATSSVACECEPATPSGTPTTVLCSDNTTCSSANLSMETTLTVNTSASITPIIHIPGIPTKYTLYGQSVQKVLN